MTEQPHGARVAGGLTGGASSPPGLLLLDRLAIVAGLFGVTVVSWLYMWLQAAQPAIVGATAGSGMGDMAGMAMSAVAAPWTAAAFALTLVMWWVMMVGMMLPSAAPMILTFATINRRKRARGRPFVPTAVFATGYLIAWGAFSLAAALAQGGLQRAALHDPDALRPRAQFLGACSFSPPGFTSSHRSNRRVWRSAGRRSTSFSTIGATAGAGRCG